MTIPYPKEGYPPYQFVAYSKWKYSRNGDGKIVQNREEELALGADWYDTPTAAQAVAEKQQQ